MMALISKGAALRASGQYDQAIVLYDKVLTIDPSDVYAIGGKADSSIWFRSTSTSHYLDR